MTVAETSTGYSLQDGPLRPGVRAGSYLIERRLGSGGMGAVYAATHIGLDKPVALKALHRSYAVQEKSVKRFVREGRAASRIRHPHVVDVTDVGSHDGVPFLVMEKLDGEDLEQYLDRMGSIELTRLTDIMLPVIDAVATAHDAGVIHRDLKPSNIFLSRDGRGHEVPKVLDFGIARMLHEQGDDRIRLTQQGAFVGTPYYASPEQATNGRAADERSDQYSIGAIIYQLASGELPVKGKTPFEVLTAIVCGEVTPFHTLRDTWHPALVEVVEKSMRFDAGDRFTDLRQLGRALLGLANDETYARYRAVFGAPVRNRSPERYQATRPFSAASADGVLPPRAAMEAQGYPPQPDPNRVQPNMQAVPANMAPIVPGTRRALPRVTGPAASFSATGASVAEPVLEKKRSSRGKFYLLALWLVLVSAGLGGYWLYENRTLPPTNPVRVASEPQTVSLQVTPETASIELDGERVGTGSAELPDDGETHQLRVSLEGFETLEREIAPGEVPTSLSLVAAAEGTEPPTTVVDQDTAEGVEAATGATGAEAADDAPPIAEPTDDALAEGSEAADSTSNRTTGRRRAGRSTRPTYNQVNQVNQVNPSARSGARNVGSTRPVRPRPVRPATRPFTRRVGANGSPVLQ